MSLHDWQNNGWLRPQFRLIKAESLSSFSAGQRPANAMYINKKPQRGGINVFNENPSPKRKIGFLLFRDDDAPLGLVMVVQSHTGRCPVLKDERLSAFIKRYWAVSSPNHARTDCEFYPGLV